MKWAACALLGMMGITQTWAAPPSADRGVQGSLSRAVSESVNRLGSLDPWKRRIFDEEVVPQYSRFIKDYRPGANGLVIEVDYDAILRYVAFYAPRTLKPADPKQVKIALYQRVEPGCDRCAAAQDRIRQLMKPRAERRGFQVMWLTAEDIPPADEMGPAVFDKIGEAAVRKGALGALIIDTRVAPVDAIDTAHADERKFVVEAFWFAKPTGDADLRFVGQLEVMENDPLEQAAARLLSDAVSQFGVKALLAEKNDGEAKTQEYELVLNGVKDYAQFAKLKAGISHALSDATWVEERKLKRGQVVLGIRSQRSVDAVKRQLASVPAEAGKVVVTGVEGERLDAEVRER
jgi:hypothetical protein